MGERLATRDRKVTGVGGAVCPDKISRRESYDAAAVPQQTTRKSRRVLEFRIHVQRPLFL